MRYWIVWLDRFRIITIRATSKDAAQMIIVRGKNEWPNALLGNEIQIFDELPKKEDM